MSGFPSFTLQPHVGMGALSVANTNRDGTGTLASVFTAPAAGGSLAGGSRIDVIEVVAAGTVTAGVIRLFLFDGASTTKLWQEILVTPATTPGPTVKVWSTKITIPEGLIIPAGWILKASTHNAEAFNVFARGGDF